MTESVLDLEAIRKRHQALSRGRGRAGIWKPSEGENIIRLIPFTHGRRKFPYLESAQHFGLMAHVSNEKMRRIPIECPLALYGDRCPADELIKAILDDKNSTKEDLELADELKPRHVFYFNILDLKATDEGIQIFPCSPGLAMDIMGYMMSPRHKDFLSTEKGWNLILTNTPSKQARRYSLQLDADRSAVKPEIVKAAKDLFLYTKCHTFDYIHSLLEKKEPAQDDEQRSRVDVMGEPDEHPENWTLYVASADGAASEPETIQVEEAPTEAEAAVSAAEEPPARVPMTEEDKELPHCCGTEEEPTGRHDPKAPECEICFAENMCKTYSVVDESPKKASDTSALLKKLGKTKSSPAAKKDNKTKDGGAVDSIVDKLKGLKPNEPE